MPGCGKDEFIRVCLEFGYQVTRMGDVVRNAAAQKGLPFSDSSVGGMADDERKAHGSDIWARRTLPFITSTKAVIDGLRSIEELKAFKEEFGTSTILVSIISSPETRFERLVGRGRDDDIVSREEFEERDRRELAWGIADVIDAADVRLENEGNLGDFRAAVRDLLNGLME